MKRDENKTLCWIMIWGWMTWKRSLAFNNDDGKNCTKKTINKSIYKKLYNLFTKKKTKKKLVFLPACRPSSHSIHVLFPEIEIKRQLRENFLLTRTAFWHSKLQTIIYTDLSLSTHINRLACLSLSLWALHSSSSFSPLSSASFFTLFHSALLKISDTSLNNLS